MPTKKKKKHTAGKDTSTSTASSTMVSRKCTSLVGEHFARRLDTLIVNFVC